MQRMLIDGDATADDAAAGDEMGSGGAGGGDASVGVGGDVPGGSGDMPGGGGDAGFGDAGASDAGSDTSGLDTLAEASSQQSPAEDPLDLTTHDKHDRAVSIASALAVYLIDEPSREASIRYHLQFEPRKHTELRSIQPAALYAPTLSQTPVSPPLVCRAGPPQTTSSSAQTDALSTAAEQVAVPKRKTVQKKSPAAPLTCGAQSPHVRTVRPDARSDSHCTSI